MKIMIFVMWKCVSYIDTNWYIVVKKFLVFNIYYVIQNLIVPYLKVNTCYFNKCQIYQF